MAENKEQSGSTNSALKNDFRAGIAASMGLGYLGRLLSECRKLSDCE